MKINQNFINPKINIMNKQILIVNDINNSKILLISMIIYLFLKLYFYVAPQHRKLLNFPCSGDGEIGVTRTVLCCNSCCRWNLSSNFSLLKSNLILCISSK